MTKFKIGDWVRKKEAIRNDNQAYRIAEIICADVYSISWLRSTVGSNKVSYSDKACVRTCPLEATLLSYEILRK